MLSIIDLDLSNVGISGFDPSISYPCRIQLSRDIEEN